MIPKYAVFTPRCKSKHGGSITKLMWSSFRPQYHYNFACRGKLHKTLSIYTINIALFIKKSSNFIKKNQYFSKNKRVGYVTYSY